MSWFSFAGAQVLTSEDGNWTGPIFLDQLQCKGSERALLVCVMGRDVGLHQCSHSMDVHVRCAGVTKYSSGFYVGVCIISYQQCRCMDTPELRTPL